MNELIWIISSFISLGIIYKITVLPFRNLYAACATFAAQLALTSINFLLIVNWEYTAMIPAFAISSQLMIENIGHFGVLINVIIFMAIPDFIHLYLAVLIAYYLYFEVPHWQFHPNMKLNDIYASYNHYNELARVDHLPGVDHLTTKWNANQAAFYKAILTDDYFMELD